MNGGLIQMSKKTLNVILFSVLIIIAVMLMFNISFSSPQVFSHFVENRTASSDSSIEKITVKKSVWLEEGQLKGPDDKREFTIEDEDEVYSLVHTDVRVYNGGRFDRDEKSEFEIHLYFHNGEFQRYHIGEDYIIARETSDIEEHVSLTVKGNNQKYEYLVSLYE